MEPLAGDQELGACVPQDQVAVPVDQVGKQRVVGPVLGDPRVHAEERLRVRAHVDALGEVVGLVLGVRADQ